MNMKVNTLLENETAVEFIATQTVMSSKVSLLKATSVVTALCATSMEMFSRATSRRIT